MKEPNWVQDADEKEAVHLIESASGKLASTNYPGQYRIGKSKYGKQGTVGIYFHDFSGLPSPARGSGEGTRDPIFVLMKRVVTCGDISCEEDNPPIERCYRCLDKCVHEEPLGVFISRKEAEDFAEARKHNLGENCLLPGSEVGGHPPKMTGKGWYAFCIPAEGSLAKLLDAYAWRED